MIDDEVDELIKRSESELNAFNSDDELISEIDENVFFRKNSVNLVCGARGSGKTHCVMREILKCLMLDAAPYTQLFYITSKYSDDTVKKLQPLLEKYIQFNWVETKDALQLIQALEYGKANLDNEREFRKCLNAEHLPPDVIPHSILVLDDCIGIFNKTDELARKLYQTRQARITAFLLLQDVNGLNCSMKANIDSLVLFGGFSKHKFNMLLYQLPPTQNFTFELYARLTKEDYIIIDFASNTFNIHIRTT